MAAIKRLRKGDIFAAAAMIAAAAIMIALLMLFVIHKL
jgi:hypothetical protein